MHYWEGGSGFPILMLHGVGPGTSIQGNFGPVLEPLAGALPHLRDGPDRLRRFRPQAGTALFRRRPVGASGTGDDRHDAGRARVGIAGHSFGGALALKVAARSDRIIKVMTSSAVGAPYEVNEALDAFWSLPADRAALRKAMGRMVSIRPP